MRRRLNLRLLTVTLIIAVTLAGGVHWLHGYQVQRNAGDLLARADRAEEQGDPAAARDFLERYVLLAPQDSAVQARLGLLLDRTASSPRERMAAFFLLEKVVRREPERHDVRRQLVRVAIAVRRHGDARDHLQTLLEASPNDPELEELLAQCEEASAQFARAAECYAQVVRHDPHRIDSYVRRAVLLRQRLSRPEGGDEVMNQLIAANPKSVAAYLARARYRRQYHTAAQAAEDVAYVQQHLAPDDADVLLAAAELDAVQGNYEQARQTLGRAIKLHAQDARLKQQMARLELQEGRRAEAADFARDALPALGNDPQTLWNAADLLIDVREFAEARTLMTRLEKIGVPAPLDYLRARLSLAEERWAEARRLLERARPGLANVPDLLLKAHLLLAHCYQRLSNPDLRIAAYRAALEVDGTNVAARLGLAAAVAAVGQNDEAIALCTQIASRAPEAQLLAVRLRVQRELRLPPATRKWDLIEHAFKELSAEQRQSVEGRLLWAEMLVGRERVSDAQQFLETARSEQPKQVEYRSALSSLAVRQKQMERAKQLLDEAERDLGDRVEWRLARAVLPLEQTGAEKHALLSRMAEKCEAFGHTDQARLFAGLLEAALRVGDNGLARQFARKLAELRPNDVDVRFTLFRLALQERDVAAAQRLRQDIQQVEGEDGTLWRFADAAQRVRFAAEDQKSLSVARERLAEAAKGRPHWAPVALLDAEICEREGNIEAAIEQYKQAVALGERQPLVVRRVVQLLQDRRRYGEAQEVLRKLQDEAPLSADLGRLAAEVSLFNRQTPDQTLELARQAAAANAGDYRNQLWLGHILASLERQAEAEKAFRRAVELKGDVPDTWVALVLFLAGSKQTTAAELAYQDAEKKLGSAWTPLLRGLCAEALGQRDQAVKHYRAALAAQPKDAGVLRSVAGFFLRIGEHAEAQALLKQLLAGAGDNGSAVWTRRQLAVSLAASGRYTRFKEALALIDQNLNRPNPAVEDQRVRAILLAMQPSRRRESITALEQSFARLPASPDEQFLVAQLYEFDHNWPRARSQMLDLLAATEGKNPLHLAYFVTRLLQHHQLDEAELWLLRLAKLEPNSWRTVQATARLKSQQGDAALAVGLVRKFARDTGGEAMLSAAMLLEELGQNSAAEEVYRQYLATSKLPESALALATHLAKQGKFDEALDLCEKVGPQCPAEAVAAVTAGIARASGARAADIQRIERWLTAALAKKADSVRLMLALADLRDVQSRFADAQALYRQVLAKEPQNAVACNNLAVLLTLGQKHVEALELSQRALDVEGPAPYFLDTRGLIHLATHQHDEAVRDLEEAVALHATAPRCFHLAQAYHASKNSSAASAAWRKAKTLGLAANVLHPLERPAFEKLAAELDGK
jgi:tetratricopeptide (TPR) repeat protein